MMIKMTIKVGTNVKLAQKTVRPTLGLSRKAPTDEVKFWLGLKSLAKQGIENLCEGQQRNNIR